MIGRASWFARAIRVNAFVVRALLRDGAITKQAMLDSPAVKAFEDDPD
jgi:hypothetical protein